MSNNRDKYPTLQSNPSGGSFSAGGSFPTPMSPRFSDPHPWLTSLRDMKKMLDEEIELPHKRYRAYFNNGNPPIDLAKSPDKDSFPQGILDEISSVTETIPCAVCKDAYDLQQRYKLEKLKPLLTSDELIVTPTTDDEACDMLTALAQINKCA